MNPKKKKKSLPKIYTLIDKKTPLKSYATKYFLKRSEKFLTWNGFLIFMLCEFNKIESEQMKDINVLFRSN